MNRKGSWRSFDIRFTDFDDSKLKLQEDKYDGPPSRIPELHPQQPPRTRHWIAKASEVALSGCTWIILVLSFIPYSLYIIKILADDNPPANWVFLSASDANLLISVLSQVFIFCLSLVFSSMLDILRWQLASGANGVSLQAFFGLSRATQLLPALRLMRSSKPSMLLLCNYRVWFPLLGIFLGSVLKFGATFQDTFYPHDKEVGIFAGLIPLNQVVLLFLPPNLLCSFFFGWMESLTTTSKYVTRLGAEPCGDNCTAMFLPGGLELVRQVHSTLNLSILQGGVLDGAEAIKISSAPGLLLQFEQPETSFGFDLREECLEFGHQLNDSIIICIRTLGPSIAVGWSTCPSILYDAQNCTARSDWKQPTSRKSLQMTAYRQNSTTVYSSADLSIQQVTTLSPPVPLHLNESDYRAMWNKAFVPAVGAPESDTTLIRALTLTLAWLLRVDDDFFSDDAQTPQSQLRNFLTIPLQFMATCWQYANYTAAGQGMHGAFAMPPETVARARSGKLRQQFVVLGWTTRVFVGSGTVLLLLSGGLFVWLFVRADPLPQSSGVPELDILLRGGGCDGDVAVAARDGEKTLRQLVSEYDLDNRSLRGMFGFLRHKILKLVPEKPSASADREPRLVVMPDKAVGETAPLASGT